ncbi:hypothetical protein [Nesterenkonia sp. PF2B19]|uniref:hypothetical protein n=1 Tax=Nesterenkonia sp. PF2B19 TaxID=1881858 RepID=UPI000871C2D8|nr:hypothetical protein [Nesterenkonia sp. PF2B19]OSM43418.1 hypothetical protein BCY76_008380 [Nesterenkonia sp. PF2B19]
MYSAAAAHLDQVATVYDEMAARYRRAAGLGPQQRTQLVLAQDAVRWESLAGDAFRGLIDLLMADSAGVSEEAEDLASEASILAGVMREGAQVARHLAAILDAVAGLDIVGISGEVLLRRARAAVDDVMSLGSFLDDYGGVPPGLGDVIAEVLRPPVEPNAT